MNNLNLSKKKIKKEELKKNLKEPIERKSSDNDNASQENTSMQNKLDNKISEISETSEILEMNNEKLNTKEITYNKKIEIVKKINKIKKKEYLLNIFKIITTYSSEYTENTNGVFIFFHNLPDEVYEKIENYLNIIYKMHLKSDIKNIFDSEISDSNITETIYNNMELDVQNKNLTNKEKMIFRRKKYEEYLQQNQSL